MAPKDRYYYIPTAGPGFPNPPLSAEFPVPLPADLNLGEPVELEIPICDDLPRWARAGRFHKVLLRVQVTQTMGVGRISVKLNGEQLPEDRLRKINWQAFWTSPYYVVIDSVWHVYRLDWDYWSVQGPNALEVTLNLAGPRGGAHLGLCSGCRAGDEVPEGQELVPWFRGPRPWRLRPGSVGGAGVAIFF